MAGHDLALRHINREQLRLHDTRPPQQRSQGKYNVLGLDRPGRHFGQKGREREEVFGVDQGDFDAWIAPKAPFQTQGDVRAGESAAQNDDPYWPVHWSALAISRLCEPRCSEERAGYERLFLGRGCNGTGRGGIPRCNSLSDGRYSQRR